MIEKIESIICDGENLLPNEIHCKSRNGELRETRQIIMYFAKKMTKLPLARIGNYFKSEDRPEGIDHATVIHACKTIQGLRDTNRQFNEKLSNYEKRLNILSVEKKLIDLSGLIKATEYEIMSYESKLNNLKAIFADLQGEYNKCLNVKI
jgi:hypothetical protein